VLSRKLKEKEIMKKTIELLDEQHAALVQVIQFLDRKGHSDEPVREVVDKILNHSRRLHEASDQEIKEYENK
jgi:hemerythrin